MDVLLQKALRAAKTYQARAIAVAGGVAANSHLRSRLEDICRKNGFQFFKPELEYCSDNAAMIARAGLEHMLRGEVSSLDLNAYPSLKLVSSSSKQAPVAG